MNGSDDYIISLCVLTVEGGGDTQPTHQIWTDFEVYRWDKDSIETVFRVSLRTHTICARKPNLIEHLHISDTHFTHFQIVPSSLVAVLQQQLNYKLWCSGLVPYFDICGSIRDVRNSPSRCSASGCWTGVLRLIRGHRVRLLARRRWYGDGVPS